MRKFLIVVGVMFVLISVATFVSKNLSDERDDEFARPAKLDRHERAKILKRTNELMREMDQADAAPR